MGSRGGEGGQRAPVPQIVTPSPPRHLSSLSAFAPRAPSRHNPVRLLMFTCMFNDCTRVTTHRSMSALFLSFLYIYLYLFFLCRVPCFVQIGSIAGSFGRRFHIDSSTWWRGRKRVGWWVGVFSLMPQSVLSCGCFICVVW